MKTIIWSLIFVLTMFMVTACGSDTNTPASSEVASQANDTADVSSESTNPAMRSTSGKGNAEFTFSGGIEETFTGEAMHMIQETTAGKVFMLTVYSYQDENNFTAISIVNMKGNADLGDFALTDDADYKVGFLQNVAGVMSYGGPNSGSLVLGSSGGPGLTGTLNFSGDMMTGSDYENAKAVTVEATFVAMPGTIDDLPKGLGKPGN